MDDWRTPHLAKRQLLAPLPSTPVSPLLVSLPPFTCPLTFSLGEHSHDSRFFRCGTSMQPDAPPMCIHLQQACNGVTECPDLSDERESVCRSVGRSAPCVTTGGPDTLRRCALPFVYRGERFSACALDDTVAGIPWCPTELDGANAYSAFSSWGECGPGCPVEESRRLQEDGCTSSPGDNPSTGEWKLHCAPPPPPPPQSPPAPPPNPPPPTPPSPPLSPPPYNAQLGSGLILIGFFGTILFAVLRAVCCSVWRSTPLLRGSFDDADEDAPGEPPQAAHRRASRTRGKRSRASRVRDSGQSRASKSVPGEPRVCELGGQMRRPGYGGEEDGSEEELGGRWPLSI